jgi:glutamine synthetase
MGLLRQDSDLLETLIDSDYWPLPSYSDMLFNV